MNELEVMFAGGLELSKQARVMEKACELWTVRQSPGNQYPEGHSYYSAPSARPFTAGQVREARGAAHAVLLPLWNSLPATAQIGPVGAVGLWQAAYGHCIPAIVVSTRHGSLGGFIERLDDMPREEDGRRARYRLMQWCEFRALTPLSPGALP